MAQPDWVMNFSDGYYLSKNIVVVKDPLFNSPASIQDWTVSASPSTLANLIIKYAPGICTERCRVERSMQCSIRVSLLEL